MSSSESGGGGVSIPSWVYDLRALLSLLGVSTLGVSLIDDPVGWVQAVLLKWLADRARDLAGVLGATIADLFGLLGDVLGDAGRAAVLSPLTLVGETVLDLIAWVQQFAVDLAAGLGPLAPIGVLVVWALVAVAGAYGLRALLGVLKWVT